MLQRIYSIRRTARESATVNLMKVKIINIVLVALTMFLGLDMSGQDYKYVEVVYMPVDDIDTNEIVWSNHKK